MSGSEALSKKIQGLKVVVRILERHEVLTTYGIGYHDGPKKLAAILSAISGFRSKNASILKSGLLVLMISNFNDSEWSMFLQFISDELRSKIKVLSVIDLDERSDSVSLGAHEILILKIGRVEHQVWNYLMCKSTYPPLATGSIGASFLGDLGRPFIQTANHTHATNDITYVHTQSVYQAIMRGDLAKVERFIADFRDPGSQMSKDFLAYGEQSSGERDKFESILDLICTDELFITVLQGN